MKLKILKIFGIILAFFLCFPLHFLYDKLPCFITSIIAPVNESIWEHMKILFGSIIISGVVKIESFDSEEFLMETTLGYLVIKGSELEIIKLDTYQGNVSIKGKIDSIMYLDGNNKKENENSLLNKLFK